MQAGSQHASTGKGCTPAQAGMDPLSVGAHSLPMDPERLTPCLGPHRLDRAEFTYPFTFTSRLGGKGLPCSSGSSTVSSHFVTKGGPGLAGLAALPSLTLPRSLHSPSLAKASAAGTEKKPMSPEREPHRNCHGLSLMEEMKENSKKQRIQDFSKLM